MRNFVDSLASHVFLVFAYKTSQSDHHCFQYKHRVCLADDSFIIHRNVWLAQSASAPALWYNDWDVNHQNMVFLSICQGWIAMFTEEQQNAT